MKERNNINKPLPPEEYFLHSPGTFCDIAHLWNRKIICQTIRKVELLVLFHLPYNVKDPFEKNVPWNS